MSTLSDPNPTPPPNPYQALNDAVKAVGAAAPSSPHRAEPPRTTFKNPWVLSTAILAGVLLIAVSVLGLGLTQTRDELETTQASLTQTQTDLTNSQAQLTAAQQQIEEDKRDLATAQADAASQRASAEASSEQAAANKAAAVEGLECIGTLLESGSNIFDNPEYAASVLERGKDQCVAAIDKLQALQNSQGA